MIDHDGTGGYNTKLGHGDAIHLTNIDIDRKGLEVWTCHEETPSRAGSELRDAATGKLLWGIPAVEDVGRAMTADIDPRFRGCEVWSTGSNGVYTADGKFICSTMPPVNMAIWWDGTLNRELLDGKGGRFERNARIFKWNIDKTEIYELPDNGNIMMNNGTKSNPSLCCDLIGDWREELLVRTKDNKELRIYITDFPTDYRFFSLMSDQIYRNSIATQNIGYNQPSHTGFYLGSDLGEFWNKKRFYEKNRKRNNPKDGLTNDGKINGMNERLNFSFTKPIKDILCYNDSINIDLKFDYEDYCIKVDNVEIKADRYITLKRNEYDENRAIPLEIKVYYHGATFFDIGSVTFVKQHPKQ